MSLDEKFFLIRNYDLWSKITDDEYEELGIIHHFMSAEKDDYIYFDSHHHNKLYFLKDGHIKIGYVDDSGREIVKEIVHKGEIFGQITLERDNLQGEFARAHRGEVSLCAFNVEDFQKLLDKKPALALRYSKQVGTKLRNIEMRLINLLNKDVRSRLVYFLIMLAHSSTAQKPEGSVVIDNFLTHEDIAQLIGSTRQTVTAQINDLERQGLLAFTRESISIASVKNLQNSLHVG